MKSARCADDQGSAFQSSDAPAFTGTIDVASDNAISIARVALDNDASSASMGRRSLPERAAGRPATNGKLKPSASMTCGTNGKLKPGVAALFFHAYDTAR